MMREFESSTRNGNRKNVFRRLLKKRSQVESEKKSDNIVIAEIKKEPPELTISDQFGNKFSSIPELCMRHGLKFEYFKEVQPGLTLPR